MNKKSQRPSEPGVRAYLLFLILFAAASLLAEQYILAAVEGGIIVVLVVYAIITGRNNRRELMEYIESITYDTETAKNNTLQNFPLPIAVFGWMIPALSGRTSSFLMYAVSLGQDTNLSSKAMSRIFLENG